jgi:hypothetical protein
MTIFASKIQFFSDSDQERIFMVRECTQSIPQHKITLRGVIFRKINFRVLKCQKKPLFASPCTWEKILVPTENTSLGPDFSRKFRSHTTLLYTHVCHLKNIKLCICLHDCTWQNYPACLIHSCKDCLETRNPYFNQTLLRYPNYLNKE